MRGNSLREFKSHTFLQILNPLFGGGFVLYLDMIDVNKDGIEHINAYSQGKTILGRFLSNFHPCYLEIDGLTFGSIESYWYYLGLEHTAPKEELDKLRPLYGLQAKTLGNSLRKRYKRTKNSDFENLICAATKQKLQASVADYGFYMTLQDTPIVHYYKPRSSSNMVKLETVNLFQIKYLNDTLRVELGLQPLPYEKYYGSNRIIW